jgi:hypothetical protein
MMLFLSRHRSQKSSHWHSLLQERTPYLPCTVSLTMCTTDWSQNKQRFYTASALEQIGLAKNSKTCVQETHTIIGETW